jgi:hypothetical protein
VFLTRDQLVADWRKRLATTNETDPDSLQRATWLARVRRRLYRFLLSLYGDGLWNSGAPVDPVASGDKTDSLVFDAPDLLPLAGKPPKSEGKIRAALKSVANCQDDPPNAGSLTADELVNSWFVVAAMSSNLNVWDCESLLRRCGIECRIQARGDDLTVEVPGLFRKEAIALLDKRRKDLRQSRHRVQAQRLRMTASVLCLTFVTSVMCFVLLLILVSLVFGQPLDRTTALPLAAALAGAICVALASYLWAVRRNRNRAASKKPG